MPPLSRTAGRSNQSHVNRLNNFGEILTQTAKYDEKEMLHKNFLEEFMIVVMKNPLFLPLSRRQKVSLTV